MKDSRLKHIDFILADYVILLLSFLLANYWYHTAYGGSVAFNTLYRNQSLILVFALTVSVLIGKPYKNVLKRDKYQELKALLVHTFRMFLIYIVAMYFMHISGAASRLTTIATWIIYITLQVVFRFIWRRVLRVRLTHSIQNMKAVVLLTSSGRVQRFVDNVYRNPLNNLRLVGIFLTDYDKEKYGDSQYQSIPILGNKEDMLNYAVHNWVDEIILYLPGQQQLVSDMSDSLDRMGMTFHIVLLNLANRNTSPTYINKMGDYIVATTTIREIPPLQALLKRVIDILGGIVGCVFTLIFAIIIGPMIYEKSPGPIFFAQRRVGINGKTFRMFKFRSMYMDAERRKAELMKQNKIQSGMMFKMDDDPRIIGSEKKDKNGKPKGIGNFIRNTSIDEFPQFFNVLKGDMSLVGTRPPTLDEWEKYSEHHRKRLTIRPGITGLWQISGRSDITDFDEVVRLDSEYIDTWTIAMDIKIILKTIAKVLKREGAE